MVKDNTRFADGIAVSGLIVGVVSGSRFHEFKKTFAKAFVWMDGLQGSWSYAALDHKDLVPPGAHMTIIRTFHLFISVCTKTAPKGARARHSQLKLRKECLRGKKKLRFAVYD